MRRIRWTIAATAAILTVGMVGSAQAFGVRTVYGTPGNGYYVSYPGGTSFPGPQPTPAYEGGKCFNGQPAHCSNPDNDQMFLNGIRFYSSPAYTGNQNIHAVTWAYWQDTDNQWNLWATHDQGTCYNKAGSGAQACRFGSPSPDQLNVSCDSNSNYCYPAFIDMPPNRNWTMVLEVTWSSSSTGANLARAFYYTHVTRDMGCAGYASANGYCVGPYSVPRANLKSPFSTVTDLGMS